ncbi:MAG TPA: glycoside hydrolase family 3 N-terminal domain-containing protein, partial [Leptospiraceae bacterium]|nr:glycoside hydrolase family 3 N-terminal domain-containing protein [Leptospiraceae bacterium]
MFQFARGFLITAAVIVSVWYFPKKLCSQELPPVPPRAKMEKLAAEIVSRMSDEVKAGQIIHVAIAGKEADEDALKEIRKIRPGGVILFGMNLGTKEEIRTLTKDLQAEMKELKLPPLLISTDQEGGRVVRVESGVTQFPSAMAVGQTSNS